MATHFSKQTLTFLRGLKRNNDRDWFAERKNVYEQAVKAPMLALIEEVNGAMAEFAPEHVRPPQKIAMRIYRDIRFSKDKRPYKIHQSAWWAREGLQKTSGAGFYFDVSGTELNIAAGVYMPEREQLLAIRRHLAGEYGGHHAEFRSLLAGKKLRSLMKEHDGLPLTRPPKGFSAEDPALDLIRCRQWGVSATLPVERATMPSLLKDVVERFRAAAPLVALLNTPLIGNRKRPIF
ncbi:MAG: DUF2461 domain-containing protein [Acidobacteriota bacterium]|nr:DUF2461 domain-containing protein [Acidobacteriota bacterium]